MSKKNVRAHKLQGRSRQVGASRPEAPTSALETVTDSVDAFNGKIPSSAIFWGLGALALGAAAYGAYVYRDRIIEIYEETIDSFQGDSEDTANVGPQSEPTRKSKSNSAFSTADQH